MAPSIHLKLRRPEDNPRSGVGDNLGLAGLLHTQADAVIAAYEAEGMKLVERSEGE